MSRYKIVEKIGEGNYTVVYRAYDILSQKEVALKTLKNKGIDPVILKREYVFLKKCSHPYIVKVYEAGYLKDTPYFTMEYIKGEDIKQYLKKKRNEQNFWTIFSTLFLKIVAGVSHFHFKGIIHGDLKPNNILVDEQDNVKIIDFGFALLKGEKPEGTTVVYTAPEILKGNLDYRADIYAIGMIMYEIIEGKDLFTQLTPVNIVKEKLKFIPSFSKPIPSELKNLVKNMLSPEPFFRPDAKEIYSTLSKLSAEKIEIQSQEEMTTMPVVGREELIDTALKEGNKIIFYGDHGYGKSTLLKEISFRAWLKKKRVFEINKDKEYLLLEYLKTHYKVKATSREHLFADIVSSLEKEYDIFIFDDLHLYSEDDIEFARYLYLSTKKNVIFSALPLESLKKKFEEPGRIAIKNIPSLSPKEIKTLVYILFPTLSQKEELTEELYRITKGIPLLLKSIIEIFLKEKILKKEEDKFIFNREKIKGLELPKTVKEFVKNSFKELNEDEKNFLLAVHLLKDFASLSNIYQMVQLKEDKIYSIAESLKIKELIKIIQKNNTIIYTLSTGIYIPFIKKLKSYKDLLEKSIKIIEKENSTKKIYLLAEYNHILGKKEKAVDYLYTAVNTARKTSLLCEAKKFIEILIQNYPIEDIPNPCKFCIVAGDIYLLLHELKKAQTFFSISFSFCPQERKSDIHHRIAQTMFYQGNIKDAKLETIKGLKYAKDKHELLNFLSWLYIFDGEKQRAERILNHVIAHTNNKEILSNAYYNLAILYKKYNQFIKCATVLGKSIKYLKEKDIYGYALRLEIACEMLLQKGFFRNAERILLKIKNIWGKIKNLNKYTSTLINMGRIKRFENPKKALEYFHQAEIMSLKIKDYELFASALLNSAFLFETYGRTEQALESIGKLLTYEQKISEERFCKGVFYYTKYLLLTNQIEKAEEFLKTIKRKDSSWCLLSQTLVLFEKNDDKRFRKEMVEILLRENTEEEVSEALNILFEYHYNKNDLERCKTILERIKKISYAKKNPFKEVEIMLKTAILLKDKKLLEETIKRAERIHYFNAKPLALSILGKIYYEKGDYLKAYKHLKEARENFERIGMINTAEKIKKYEEKAKEKSIEIQVPERKYLDTLERISAVVKDYFGKDEFFLELLNILIEATSAERGMVMIGENQENLYCVGTTNIDEVTYVDATAFSKTVLKHVREGKRGIYTEDATKDPRFKDAESVKLKEIKSILCVPLMAKDEVIGVLYLDSSLKKGLFTEETLKFMESVSNIIGTFVYTSYTAEKKFKELERIKLKTQEIVIGRSRKIKRIFKEIQQIAQTDSNILLIGETGTGKGVIARLIHEKSRRSEYLFQYINCGAIPYELFEAELFGYKKGAFTGARETRKGLLEEAHKGTVFLDEIANIPISVQAKLLDVIERKKIRRLGENIERDIDVRFIFATNRDLEQEIEKEKFRNDLYYRISTTVIEIPPLRERKEDIPIFVDFFIDKFSKELNKNIKGVSQEAMEILLKYHWPGNIRELSNVIERAVIMADKETIGKNHIDRGIIESVIPPAPLKIETEKVKKEMIIKALQLHKGNIKKTAQYLHITRQHLSRLLKRYNIDPAQYKHPQNPQKV